MAGRAPLRVLVAPDKFKGTMTAAEAAQAMDVGVRRAVLRSRVVCLPVADGGEGTVDALVSAGARTRSVTVRGPLDRPVVARIAELGGVAYVEAAEACGLRHLRPTSTSSLRAHSAGVGDLLRDVVRLGATRVVIGLGGVACSDGGAGALAALGVVARPRGSATLLGGGGALSEIQGLDLSGLDPRLASIEMTAATDVTNPLVGEHGAARVFGPQKGAGPVEVERLEEGLAHFARLLREATGFDVAKLAGAGAAGGLSAGLVAVFGATVRSGADLVLASVGAEREVSQADLVITGEGSLDLQSLRGKTPVAMAQLAARHDVPVLVVAGHVEERAERSLAGTVERVWSLTREVGQAPSLSRPAEALTRVTAAAVTDWYARQGTSNE